jgi:hypothetical protein
MNKIELEAKRDRLYEEVQAIADKYIAEGKSWDEYCKNPTVREYWKTIAEYRLVQDYTLKPIEDKNFGEFMTLEEFKGASGVFFSDYDGSGYYATETEISNIPCVPSEICDGYIREDFTHVMWYNK